MLEQTKVQELTQTLLTVEKERRQIDQITNSYPDISVDDAYAVQLGVMRARLEQGKKAVGWKVALSNRAVQQVLGVYEPVWGHLTSDMFVLEGDPIHYSEIPQAKVEPEIAFVMKHDLIGPGVTAAQVLAATAGVMPAFDMAAPRIRDWKFRHQDMAADNAFAGRVVLGGKLTPVEGLDLRLIGMVLEKNGQLHSTGASAATLGNPVDVLVWLANKLAEYDQYLKAGEIVLPGTIVVAPLAAPGDYWRANYDRLGSVSAYFTE